MPPTLLTLPPELLLEIASYLTPTTSRTPRRLFPLLLVNRYAYTVFQVPLYTHNIRHANSSALLWAARHNRPDTAKLLLAHGADVNICAGDGETVVTSATKRGNVEVLRVLLLGGGGRGGQGQREGEGEDAGAGEGEGGLVLMESREAEIGEEEEFLGASRPDDDDDDDDDVEGYRERLNIAMPLISLAAERGHVDVVRMLLDEFGADVNTRDLLGRSVLARAAAAPLTATYWRATAAERGVAGRSNVVSWKRHLREAQTRYERMYVAVVRLLLERGADVGLADGKGWTPLARAAQSGCTKVVKVLLKHCRGAVDVDARNCDGVTPLGHAVLAGHEDIILLLLEKGRADPDPVDVDGYTPLLRAVEARREGVVRLLLSQRRKPVDVNRREICDGGKTPFTSAMCVPVEIVRLMLQLARPKPDINALCPDGRPALAVAAGEGYDHVALELLEQEGIIADQRDEQGITPLARAVHAERSEVVRALLAREDVDVNARDALGRTPLLHTVIPCVESFEVVRLLLEHGAEIDARDYEGGGTLFSRAWERREVDLMDMLLEAGANAMLAGCGGDTDGPRKPDFSPEAFLWFAVTRGHAGLVEHAVVVAVNNGILDPNSCVDAHGRTPLCVAIIEEHRDVVEILLAHDYGKENGDNTSEEKSSNKESPLSNLILPLALAAMNGHDDMVRQILSASENSCDLESDQGYMHLFRAMEQGYQEVVQMFMQLYCLLRTSEIIATSESLHLYPCWLPLFLAAVYRHVDVVQTIIASPQATAAAVALTTSNKDMKDDGEEEEKREDIDLTPLWLAAEYVWARGGTESSVKFVKYTLKIGGSYVVPEKRMRTRR
ncbi:hypothetical protein AJ79_01640 [Helicocarpus griseus UAMH5409]|uniref:Uncharacterized protein n=1 Tax=Helicocarpus griseus UAMH5409 TaxID=1447875 RepID=A0A2B7Y5Q5_9EURO|nr:hypothetical protein AJ79_01640 [Helicocarpus griseus UAMH5409]